MWNGRTKEFMGRNGKSWVQFLVFYSIFYVCLAAWWGGMLYARVYLLPEVVEGPYRTEYLSHRGPGMKMSPNNKLTNMFSFNPENEDSVRGLQNQVDAFLEAYQTIDEQIHPAFGQCDVSEQGSVCEADDNSTYFLPSILEGNGTDNATVDTLAYNLNNLGACQDSAGYAEGEPCFYFQINKIWDWSPAQVSLDSKKDRKLLRLVSQEPTEDFTPIVCSGQKGTDQFIEAIDFYPQAGFDRAFFPWTGQPNYRSPIVAAKVRLTEEGRGKKIKVACFLLADNIFPKDQLFHIGRIDFDLQVY
jgi:sodium/potassium-transporting ATPase subunit beta